MSVAPFEPALKFLVQLLRFQKYYVLHRARNHNPDNTSLVVGERIREVIKERWPK